ncbi:hypothetical protein ACQYAD_17655 [Neobacillus sp. SM06]|uniref:hypothetical protein n=1 Tax=Neobacillus sp. SM06 TaxID=3422492 RepID=UPI003D2A804C
MVFSLVAVSVGIKESDAATVRRGKISFYDGEGKLGADQKILTRYDCAVGFLYKYITKGTPIYTSNEDKLKFVTLYKWDWGGFNDPVILDVQRSAFQYDLGGSITLGYIPNGRISY